MSLTGTVPKKFSTSPRKDLISKIPEMRLRGMFCKKKKDVDPAKMPEDNSITGKIKPVP
jgi:hypothetical protein